MMSENPDVHSTEKEAEEEVWRSRGKQSSALPQSTVLPSADDDDHTRTLAGTMAEHVYSKGTRVWFVDKEQAWISAEVTQVTKGAGDAITLTLVDERGKVSNRERSLSPNQGADSFQDFTVNTSLADIKAGKEGLPPLRNPPLLETADDLATLSHLNEPSGAYRYTPLWPYLI
jgi:hypothetical protein